MRAFAAALALLAAGCSAAPFEYRSHTEIPEGPGALSGAAGSFALQPKAEEPVAPRDAAEWREFEEWRKWQREQQKK
jgi:hypothetical protein